MIGNRLRDANEARRRASGETAWGGRGETSPGVDERQRDRPQGHRAAQGDCSRDHGGFAATLRQRAQAAAVYPLSTTPVDIKRIAKFAVKNRLPTVTNTAAYIKEGLLAGHGPNVPDQYHRVAIYIDRVLKGARPADLPVEQPTKLDLVINGRTAKALGLALPQSILLRAVEVGE
jgi:putative ABC transport system substrate-binding protein